MRMDLNGWIIESLLSWGVAVPSRSHYIDIIELEQFPGSYVQAKGVALLRSFSEPLPEHEKQAARAEWEGMPSNKAAVQLGEQGTYGQFVRVAVTIVAPDKALSSGEAQDAYEGVGSRGKH